MAVFALIQNNIIENVIIAESLEDAQNFFTNFTVVEISTEPGSPSIGWSYDGEIFIPPVEIIE